jgi:hypothetical protein
MPPPTVNRCSDWDVPSGNTAYYQLAGFMLYLAANDVAPSWR